MHTKNSFRRHAAVAPALLGLAMMSLTACTDSNMSRNAKPAPAVAAADVNRAGPQHQCLEALIGNWKAETRGWRRPGAPVETGKGTMSNFWMLDGRFLGQEYKSRSQRPKYQGLGAMGYDKTQNAYTSVWLDTTSTSIYNATGSCDASGDVFTLEGVYRDPETGKPVKGKSVTHVVNKKRYTFELFKEGPDGNFFKTLDITYTR